MCIHFFSVTAVRHHPENGILEAAQNPGANDIKPFFFVSNAIVP